MNLSARLSASLRLSSLVLSRSRRTRRRALGTQSSLYNNKTKNNNNNNKEGNDEEKIKNKRRELLGRRLYRQLLKCCHASMVDPNMPLATHIPPVLLYSNNNSDTDTTDNNSAAVVIDPDAGIDDKTFQALQALQPKQDAERANGDSSSSSLALNDSSISLPPETIFEPNQITIPIQYIHDLRELIKAIFRVQQHESKLEEQNLNDKLQQQRITLGFQTIKALNQLCHTTLHPVMERKAQRMDRSGVLFSIGQIVMHKKDLWRGVVVGWDKQEEKLPTASLSSLTTKNYSSSSENEDDDDDDNVKVTVLLDYGDAAFLMGRPTTGIGNDVENPSQTVWQSELQPLHDDCLLRIRGQSITHDDFFSKLQLDKSANNNAYFVPRPALKYEYPLDDAAIPVETDHRLLQSHRPSWSSNHHPERKQEEVAQEIIQGIQSMARLLEQSVKHSLQRLEQELDCNNDDTSPPNDDDARQWLKSICREFSQLASGEITVTNRQGLIIKDMASNDAVAERATRHIQKFNKLSGSISEWVLHRTRFRAHRHQQQEQQNDEAINAQEQNQDTIIQAVTEVSTATTSRPPPRFALGEVVVHTKYNYRGVIVGWDPTPVVDVTDWDGLQDLDNDGVDVMDLPFYHVIPDQRDCVQAFGGERSFRYVCQVNLEPCPNDQIDTMQVDLDLGWQQRNDKATTDEQQTRQHEATILFVPPPEVRFKYGLDMDNRDEISDCLMSVHEQIMSLNLLQRGETTTAANDVALTNIAQRLSIDTLFEFLHLAHDTPMAKATEDMLKDVWKAHGNLECQLEMEQGTTELLRGNREQATVLFSNLVYSLDDRYAEAWNKLSTCYFVLGDMDASYAAAERTISLIPRHFQAMNGMGLIRYQNGQYSQALDCFLQSLSINPWSPVSSRVLTCLDNIKNYDTGIAQQSNDGDDDSSKTQTNGNEPFSSS